jgi:hypothetical protein
MSSADFIGHEAAGRSVHDVDQGVAGCTRRVSVGLLAWYVDMERANLIVSLRARKKYG